MMVSPEGDEIVTLWLIDRQKGARWVNYEVDDSVISGYYGYPVLVHWAVSKLPEKYRMRLGQLLNIAPDLFTCVCLYLLTSHTISQIYDMFPMRGTYLALCTCFLFLSSPILIPGDMSRMKTIKGRSWGSFFIFVFLIGLYGFAESRSIPWLLTAVSAGVFSILSSLFAFQVMVLFSIGLAIARLSWEPVFVAVSSTLVAYFVPAVKAKEPMVFYFHHKIWYFRNYDKGTTAAPRKNLRNLCYLPYYLIKDIRKCIQIATLHLPITIVVIAVPEIVALAAFCVGGRIPDLVSDIGLVQYGFQVVVVSVCVFALVCFRRFSFIGQAERYFEYSLPFISLLVPLWLSEVLGDGPAYVWCLIFCLAHISLVVSFIMISTSSQGRMSVERDQELDEMAKELFRDCPDGAVFTVPCKLGFRISYLARKYGCGDRFKYFYKFIKREGEMGFSHYEEATGGLGKDMKPSKEVLKLHPADFPAHEGATYMIVAKEYDLSLKKQWGDISAITRTVSESSRYRLLEVVQ